MSVLDQSSILRCILVNGSKLAKIKKNTFLICQCHTFYREEAVGLKSSNYTKKYDFCEYVKFGAIIRKFGIYKKIWYFVDNCLSKVQI